MEKSPNKEDSASAKQGDLRSVFQVRPLCKGIILGVIIGVVYCLGLRDLASRAELPVETDVLNVGELASGNLSSSPTVLVPSENPKVVPDWNLTTSKLTGAAATNSNRSDSATTTSSNRYWLTYDGPPLPSEEERVRWIVALWEGSPLLNNSRDAGDPLVVAGLQELGHLALRPPHLEDCAARAEEYRRLNNRNLNGSGPVWSLCKGPIGTTEHEQHLQVDDTEKLVKDKQLNTGPFPPWIQGADEDNLPLTRRVQRDMWLHQHPRNCSDDSVRFIVADWPSADSGIGLGAQLVYVGGLLAISMREKRVLVLERFDRADHQGCQGSSRARWSCYFLPETTDECRRRAKELAKNKSDARVMSRKDADARDAWFAGPPNYWGVPWEAMQPTTEIEGHLLVNYKRKDLRWWRSQSVRYLMRFPSEHTCMLMNKARHDAWGVRAASIVLRASQLQEHGLVKEADMEKWVWTSQKPWIPRPMLSVHVRIGDKAREMKLVDFHSYMALANRLRARFPQVENIWLSSEMQNVIDASKTYSGWNFDYTEVPRQVGNTSMHDYEQAVGPERSMNNAIVNFLMASDADFFVGALGSTWCFLIDGMRSTGGKQMAGYLSVNRDRNWR